MSHSDIAAVALVFVAAFTAVIAFRIAVRAGFRRGYRLLGGTGDFRAVASRLLNGGSVGAFAPGRVETSATDADTVRVTVVYRRIRPNGAAAA